MMMLTGRASCFFQRAGVFKVAMAIGGFLLLLTGATSPLQAADDDHSEVCLATLHFTTKPLLTMNGFMDIAGTGLCGVTNGSYISLERDEPDLWSVSFRESQSPITLACTYRYVNNVECRTKVVVSCQDGIAGDADMPCDPNSGNTDRHVGVIEPDGQICYQVAVDGYGWLNPVCDGTVAGTTGQGRRVQAFKAWSTLPGVSVCYSAHIQNRGWVQEACDGNEVGTWGSGLRVEALRLRASAPFEVKYKAHVQNIGWQGIVSSYQSSQFAGTTGKGLRLEAISARVGQTAQCTMVGDRPLRCTDATVSQYMSTVANRAVSQYWCSPNVDPRSSCASVSSNGTCTSYGSSGKFACVTEMQ